MAQSIHPTLLEKGIRASFVENLIKAGTSGIAEKLCSLVQSRADSEKYGWMGPPEQMEEAGSSTVSGSATVPFSALSDASYTITNRKFWRGFAVSRDDLADDQVGGIALRIAQLATVAANHRDKLVIDTIVANGNCYDGTAFFGNSHTSMSGEGTQDNLLGGSGTSTANAMTDINTAIRTMAEFIGENSEPFHSTMSQFLVLAPFTMRKPLLEALQAEYVSQTNNVQVDGLSFTVHFDARLNIGSSADANDWYMFHTGSGLKPLIFQEREPLTLERDETSGHAFETEQYRYKVRARYSCGFGFWQDAVKFVNS